MAVVFHTRIQLTTACLKESSPLEKRWKPPPHPTLPPLYEMLRPPLEWAAQFNPPLIRTTCNTNCEQGLFFKVAQSVNETSAPLWSSVCGEAAAWGAKGTAQGIQPAAALSQLVYSRQLATLGDWVSLILIWHPSKENARLCEGAPNTGNTSLNYKTKGREKSYELFGNNVHRWGGGKHLGHPTCC